MQGPEVVSKSRGWPQADSQLPAKRQTSVPKSREMDSTNNLNEPANGFFPKLPSEISDVQNPE